MEHLYNYSLEELTEYFQSINEKPFRAKQVFQWLYQKNAFDFQGVFNFKSNNYDFSFFENYDFQKNYDFQNKNNYFYFSDLFFFNSLQSNDFSFLHRDFYSFYPIFKYMTMCDIL